MKGERRAGNGSARRSPGRTLALVLAILVHVAFVGVLIWSVRWQSRPPEPIVAELYAPPPKVRAPDPEPKVEPPPPRTEPKVEPPPPPPPPKAEPDQAEIALKAKREEERRERERERLADEKRKADEKRAAEEKRIADEKRKADEKRAAEARERQKRETDAMLAQAQKEATQRAEQDARARVEAEARAKAQAEANARDRAGRLDSAHPGEDPRQRDAAAGHARQSGSGVPGDPVADRRDPRRALGEVQRRQGLRRCGQPRDPQVEPAAAPDRQEMFQRELELKFRPLD